MTNNICLAFASIPLLFLLCPLLQADSVSLAGTVSDASGGALANAMVTITNTGLGVALTTRTNASGAYEFPGLQTGAYSLAVSLANFTTAERTGIVLRVGDRVRVDLSLATGAEKQSLLVTEAVPLVELDSNSTSTVINRQAVEDLPSNGRQLQNFAQLVPGVSGGWNLSTLANRYGKARENTEGAFTVNGARSRSNDFIFDGAPINLRQYGVINFEPSNEAVQEFQVLTSIPAPEYGRTIGGVVNIVTRAGTNQFHGAFYEFFRNNVLDANNTFNNRAGLPRGEVRQNQFGGTIGGPIYRQKHFFFLNGEIGKNIVSDETRLTSVPTAGERAGLVSYVDSAGAPRTVDVSSRITPLSAKLLALYPAPNVAGNGLNYNTPLPITLNDYQYHQRSDHYFGKDIVTLRTSWDLNDQVYVINRFGGPYLPGFSLPNPEETTNGTLGYIHPFGPASVNEAHLGVNRYTNRLGNGDTRSAAAIGLPNGDSANGIPSLTFTAGNLEQLGGASFYNRDQNELTVYFSDGLSVLRGNHHFKFGGELSRFQFNTRGATNERGTVLFDGSRNRIIPRTAVNERSGALADFLLGLPFEANITTGQFGRGYRGWAWALYAQDNWKFSRVLTLNYGLRYDRTTPWTEVNGKLSNFIPGQGLVTPRTPGYSGLYRADHLNLGPRIGLAWDISGKGGTIVRTGFGIRFDSLLQASTVQQIENNPPFSGAAVSFAPTPFSRDGSPSRTLLDLRSITQPSNSVAALPASLPNPKILEASFSLQQALGSHWVAELGFHYTRGLHLPVNYNINQVPMNSLTASQRATIQQAAATPAGSVAVLDALRPFTGFDSITLFNNVAVSTYNSLQLKIERRFQTGLNLLASYSYSKSIDDATDFASGDSSEQVLNSYNLTGQRGPSSFDITHRFIGAFNYPIPSAPGFRAVTGGWQLNGVLTFQGGQPFTPYTSAFDPFRNESFNRLNVIGDPLKNLTPGYAYNPAAFATPAPGTFGNNGRNIVRGGGFDSVDLSLFRNFRVGEHVRAQLRFEATNSFNHVNYQGPVVNQNSSPGQFIGAAPPREVQLGIKVSF